MSSDFHWLHQGSALLLTSAPPDTGLRTETMIGHVRLEILLIIAGLYAILLAMFVLLGMWRPGRAKAKLRHAERLKSAPHGSDPRSR